MNKPRVKTREELLAYLNEELKLTLEALEKQRQMDDAESAGKWAHDHVETSDVEF